MSKLMPSREAEISSRLLKHWHEAVPDDRMAHLVKDAARSFVRSLQARLQKHGVSIGHWVFLRILWEQDGLTQRELSNEAGLMEPTTVAALRAMEALGYISRSHADNNRKSVHVFLTSEGRALKRKLVPLAEEVNALAARSLTKTDINTVRRGLLVMLDNLASDKELVAPEHSSRAKKP